MADITDKYHCVLYNNRYGGFGINTESQIEYNRRATERGSYELYDLNDPHDSLNDEQYNPILIEMFLDKEWNIDGTRMDSRCTKIDIALFDKKFEGFISIDEYDGKETPYVDMGRYLKVTTARILYDTTLDDTTKIQQLQAIIKKK